MFARDMLRHHPSCSERVRHRPWLHMVFRAPTTIGTLHIFGTRHVIEATETMANIGIMTLTDARADICVLAIGTGDARHHTLSACTECCGKNIV